MTINEIFKKIAEHQIKGIMIHQDLSNYYDFLGLKGYKRCHEYHFYKEMINFRKLNRYYINNHNMLIPQITGVQSDIMPVSWYQATRMEVDNGTKRNGIKNAINKWVEWEKSVKELYEQSYTELMNINDISTALFIKDYICDVDCELKYAYRKWLDLKAIDYDLSVIIPEQEYLHDKYQKMSEELEIC